MYRYSFIGRCRSVVARPAQEQKAPSSVLEAHAFPPVAPRHLRLPVVGAGEEGLLLEVAVLGELAHLVAPVVASGNILDFGAVPRRAAEAVPSSQAAPAALRGA
jgi:hypothetical protein